MSEPRSKQSAYRPYQSRILRESREVDLRALRRLDPAARMKAAFAISMDAMKLQKLCLLAQGFKEEEISKARQSG